MIVVLAIVAGVIWAIASSGGEDESVDRSEAPTVEDCFDPWDGHLNALEDLVRPLLNDRPSMQTHETRFSSTPQANGYHLVSMAYSAKNAFGGRLTFEAIGEVHPRTCHVRLVDSGL